MIGTLQRRLGPGDLVIMLSLQLALAVCLLTRTGEALKRVNLILPELENLHFNSCPTIIPSLDTNFPVFFVKNARKRALEEAPGVKRYVFDPTRGDGGVIQAPANANGTTSTPNGTTSKPNANGSALTPNGLNKTSCYIKASTVANRYVMEVPTRAGGGVDFSRLGPWLKIESIPIRGIKETNDYQTYGSERHQFAKLQVLAEKYLKNRPTKTEPPMMSLLGIRRFLIGTSEIALTNTLGNQRAYLFVRDSLLYKCYDTTEDKMSDCMSIDFDPVYKSPQDAKYKYEAPLTTGLAFKTSNNDKLALFLMDATGRLMATTINAQSLNKEQIVFDQWYHYGLGAASPLGTGENQYNDLVRLAPNDFMTKMHKLEKDLDKAHIESISMVKHNSQTKWCYDSLFLATKLCVSGADSKRFGGISSNGTKKVVITYAHHEYSPDGKRLISHEVMKPSGKNLVYLFRDSDKSLEAKSIDILIAPSDIIGYNDNKCNVTITLYDFIYTVHKYDESLAVPKGANLLEGLNFQIKAAVTLATDVYFFTTRNSVVKVPVKMAANCDTFAPNWSGAEVSQSQDFIRRMVLIDEQRDDSSVVVTYREYAEGATDSEPPIGAKVPLGPGPGPGPGPDPGSGPEPQPQPQESSGSKTVVIVVILVLIVVALIAIGIVYFFCMPCKRNRRAPKRKSRKQSSHIHNTIRSGMSNTSKVGSQTAAPSIKTSLPKMGHASKNRTLRGGSSSSVKMPRSPAKSRVSLGRQSPSNLSKRISSPTKSRMSAKAHRSPIGRVPSMKQNSRGVASRSPSASQSPSGSSHKSLSPSSPGASAMHSKHHNSSASPPRSPSRK